MQAGTASASSLDAVAPTPQSVHGPLVVNGRWLLPVRISWLAFVIAAAWYAIFVQQQLRPQLSYLDEESPGMVPGEIIAEGLRQLGISPWALAWLTVGLSVVTLGVCFSLAALLFRRKSNEVMALFVGVFLVASSCPVYPPDLVTMAETEPFRAAIGTVITFTFFTSFVMLFLLFPNGRVVPR